MQTKHLYVLIHNWTKGEVGAPWNQFKPSSKIILLTLLRRYFFCGSFVLFMFCVCVLIHIWTMVLLGCRETGLSPPVKYFLLTVHRRFFFCGSFVLFMLCVFVLIHIWNKGEVGAPWNRFKPFSKIFLLIVPRLCFFCGSFMLFLSWFLLCFRARLFIDGFWLPAGKGLISWLLFVMSYCEVITFPLVSWVRCGGWLYWFLIFALFYFQTRRLFYVFPI